MTPTPAKLFTAARFRCFTLLFAIGIFLASIASSPGGQSASARKALSRTPARASDDSSQSRAAEKELARLARALREEESSGTYARLSQLAARESASTVGARAALALGYYDFSKGRHRQAQVWLHQAQNDALLREYVSYWAAQVNLALGRHSEALAQLEAFRREFPESVMTEQVVRSLAEASLALGEPDRAVAALAAYDKVSSKPSLQLLRAQAREKAAGDTGGSPTAARDYQAIYYRFPLSDEAKVAETKLAVLKRALGKALPAVPIELQEGRAAALYEVRRWREARSEYERLLPRLRKTPVSARLERAELRIAQCRVQLGGAPSALASLALADPELDAERLYSLSQFRRSKKQEAEMLATIARLTARYPHSRWAEEGLFAAGNYFWVKLDRQHATAFYRRALEQFPSGKNAQAAHWRLAWVAYLERRPEAAGLLEEHMRRYPGSSYTADALYWLGRRAERSGNTARARSFYLKAQERFPHSYFGRQAASRLSVLGVAPVNSAGFLDLILSPSALPLLEEAVPPGAATRWARAQALRSIAFDVSAELELRAAYGATGVPRLLWEASQAALDAGRYPVAITAARQVYPQLESRKIQDVPQVVWRTVYPLPYEESMRRAAARHQIDPMLVAGLVRQESTFQPDAVSRAGAVGLMQVLPKTGRKLARRLRWGFSRVKLSDPEYNLRLGTLYLAELLRTMGGPEAALAAFNAGEERVALWESERSFAEPAEFVESIPFTETREYVQIVMRNAEIYRLLYGKLR